MVGLQPTQIGIYKQTQEQIKHFRFKTRAFEINKKCCIFCILTQILHLFLRLTQKIQKSPLKYLSAPKIVIKLQTF